MVSENKTARLEALLFSEGSEMKKTELMRLLTVDANALELLVRNLRAASVGRGLVLVESDTTLALRTAPDQAAFLSEIQKESLKGDVGKAGLETLAILLYRGLSTRAEIDYIRGVNSSFIVRHLLVRGLIEREKRGSQFVYKPSINALSLLGVSNLSDLPDFERIKGEIQTLEQNGEVMHND
jgi:segregation and condensation protein B